MSEKENKLIDLGFGGLMTDGSHHKQWYLEEMLKIICGDSYEHKVVEYKSGEDGPETYSWEKGIIP